MKRDSRDYESEGPPKKMQRANLSNISVRFLIPARAAGLIIGKGGENIKKIRSQYSVKLNIPDTRGTERVFAIEGALSDICNVWREIMPKLKDVMSARLSDPKVIMGQGRLPRRKRVQDGDGEKNEGDQPEEEEDDKMIDLRLLVHQSIAGCIIGKGGDRIRELRQKHKMRVIKVYQMFAPGSTDRVVQLIAEPENAIQCMEAIVEVAEVTTIRGPTELYDATNCCEADALTYGGWLSPEGLQALSQGMPLNGGAPPSMGGRYGPPRGGLPPPMYPGRQRGGPPMYQPPRGGPPRQPQQQWGYDGGYPEGGYVAYPQQPPVTGTYDVSQYAQPPQTAYNAPPPNTGVPPYRPVAPTAVAPPTAGAPIYGAPPPPVTTGGYAFPPMTGAPAPNYPPSGSGW
uniref:KH domain-containing protein n=3 Tax=Mesocestoides corti TaxID=53468 RepID=A0A5K3FHU1_MESCO